MQDFVTIQKGNIYHSTVSHEFCITVHFHDMQISSKL